MCANPQTSDEAIVYKPLAPRTVRMLFQFAQSGARHPISLKECGPTLRFKQEKFGWVK